MKGAVRRHGSLPNILEEISLTNDISSIDEPAGRFKLIVVGDEKCGKTSLLYAFSRKNTEMNPPVVFEDDVSTMQFGTKRVDFLIWDLSGLTEYDGFRCELYKDTDLFLVCFDIGNPDSLDSVEDTWIPEIVREEPKTPFILVGCKNDLRTDTVITKFDDLAEISLKHRHNSSVSRQRAEKVGTDWGGKEYIECCAKTGFQIPEVFRAAAQVLLTPVDEKNGGFKGFSKFARRKSSEITGLFGDKCFLSATRSINNLRRKSAEVEDFSPVKGSPDKSFFSFALPNPTYNRNMRRSSAFA